MQADGIGRFLGWSLLALLVLMVPWYFLAEWLAAPALELAGGLMHFVFPTWAEGVQRSGTVGALITRVGVYIPQQGQMLLADMTPEVNFLKYGYGVVLLWAMLLASRPPKWLLKIAIGKLKAAGLSSTEDDENTSDISVETFTESQLQGSCNRMFVRRLPRAPATSFSGCSR